MAVYIAPAALGLGDLVVALPIVQQLIAKPEPVFLVVRLQEHRDFAARIPNLAGVCLEWDLPGRMGPGDRFIDLRDHPLEKVAWWGSKPWLDTYPGWTINDILATICSDKGLNVNLDAPFVPLDMSLKSELSDKVAFVPGSAVSAKGWSLESWLELSKAIDPVVIGERDKSPEVAALIEAGVPWYQTNTLADALDAVSSVRAVVSVDTGIMHMAVHQGTPTVGVFRWSPVYIRERENFVGLAAARPCEPRCYDRELGASHHGKPEAGKDFCPHNWSCAADAGSRCMDSISVQAVLSALAAVKDQRDRRHPQKDIRPLPARP